MSANRRAYLDTSALAKWYLNEPGSDAFVRYLQGLDVAVVSSLTRTEVRSMLARRRRMGALSHELESVVYAAFLNDIAQGWLQLYPVEDARFDEAANLIARYPEHPLRTLDALHLAIALQAETDALATADSVMADTAIALDLEVVRF
ncbi:MAG: type II toxin-antitoxin system VapC family toxin [Halochromatium sp.]|uniref:type II toxin-antitoxin system VapC family toxin n=1 Tax=Halochromatium sp. TaxID=2049430 RepID=UPI0039780827